MASPTGDADGASSPAYARGSLTEGFRQTALDADGVLQGSPLQGTDEGLGYSSGPAPTGLDKFGNPLLSLFTTDGERKLASLQPVINVDWRGGKAKDCNGPSQRRAAQVQRVATCAPAGESCVACGKGFGPFSTCRVLVYDGQLQFNGSCANCSFNGNGKSCSFRSDTELLPEWIRPALFAQNPNHPALREPTEASVSKGKRRVGEVGSSPSLGAEQPREVKKPRGRLDGTKATGKECVLESTGAAEDNHFPLAVAPTGPYANDWYQSPLDDARFRMKNMDWDAAREALRVLPETVARAMADYHSLHACLRDAGQLPAQLQQEEEEDENPFYGKYQ